jgi:hypothetical protein
MPAITFSVDAFPAFWIVSNTEHCPFILTMLVRGGKPSRTRPHL